MFSVHFSVSPLRLHRYRSNISSIGLQTIRCQLESSKGEKAMKTCCFGLTLRTGCIFIGLLNLVPLLVAFVGIPVVLLTTNPEKYASTWYVVSMVLVTLVYVPSNIVLLIGTSDRKPGLLMVWLLVYAFTWITLVIFFLYKLVHGIDKTWFLLGLLAIAVLSHMIFIVYSHCKELRTNCREENYDIYAPSKPAHQKQRRISTASLRSKSSAAAPPKYDDTSTQMNNNTSNNVEDRNSSVV